jgi:hypothetical protein
MDGYVTLWLVDVASMHLRRFHGILQPRAVDARHMMHGFVQWAIKPGQALSLHCVDLLITLHLPLQVKHCL